MSESEWMSEWGIKWVSKSEIDRVSKCVNEGEGMWVNKGVCEWGSQWESEWISESKWVNEWLNGFPSCLWRRAICVLHMGPRSCPSSSCSPGWLWKRSDQTLETFRPNIHPFVIFPPTIGVWATYPEKALHSLFHTIWASQALKLFVSVWNTPGLSPCCWELFATGNQAHFEGQIVAKYSFPAQIFKELCWWCYVWTEKKGKKIIFFPP